MPQSDPDFVNQAPAADRQPGPNPLLEELRGIRKLLRFLAVLGATLLCLMVAGPLVVCVRMGILGDAAAAFFACIFAAAMLTVFVVLVVRRVER